MYEASEALTFPFQSTSAAFASFSLKTLPPLVEADEYFERMTDASFAFITSSLFTSPKE